VTFGRTGGAASAHENLPPNFTSVPDYGTMAARPPLTALSRGILLRPALPRQLIPAIAHCRVHIRATPSTTSIDGIVDLSEQTQAIPKLSGAGPFPAGFYFPFLPLPNTST